MRRVTVTLVVPLCALVLVGIVCAEEHHGGDEKGHHHGGAREEVKVPDNYAEAVGAIEKQRDACTKLIENGKLEDLHKEGAVIKKIAESLAKLASKEDSGVVKADIKEINLTAKDLASKYALLDEAGDNGKMDEAKKVLEEMSRLIETLKKHAKK